MILVTGATGTIGSEVVRQLAARGEKVRALTRNPEKAQVPSGVETARGHHADRASVQAAMAGAEVAFLVGVFGPDDAGHDAGLVEAARAAGVHRVVKLSVISAGDPKMGAAGNWHVAGEEAVRASGLEWTVLRPSAFASNAVRNWAQAIRAGTPAANMMGDARQGVVDPRDVSEIAVAALLDARHSGRTYTLTGPEAINAAEQAAVLGEVLGRPVELLDLSPEQTREQLLASGLSETYVAGVMGSLTFILEGGNAIVTEDVPDVLGRPARSFRKWAEDHREAFAPE